MSGASAPPQFEVTHILSTGLARWPDTHLERPRPLPLARSRCRFELADRLQSSAGSSDRQNELIEACRAIF